MQRTKIDSVHCTKYLVDDLFPEAGKIVVVDSLTTHGPAFRYEAFEPAEAKRMLDQLEFRCNPKHGNWLNMVEIEISVLCEQGLPDRIPDVDTLGHEIAAWETTRNEQKATVNWQFSTNDPRNKL